MPTYVPHNSDDRLSFTHIIDQMLRTDPALIRDASNYRKSQKENSSRWYPGGAVYVNRDSGRRYRPHHQDEVSFLDDWYPRYLLCKGAEGGGKSVAGIVKTLERLRNGMNGIMGCVAAETLIEGVPAAEWQGGWVSTLGGLQASTKSFLKGRTDLYRVRTDLGHEVVVTLDHRFLTPTGWRRLRDLRAGELIASGDKLHESGSQETPTGWSNGCLSDPHRDDVLPILSGEEIPDIEQLLADGLGTSGVRCYDPFLSHLYTCDSLLRGASELDLVWEDLLQLSLGDDKLRADSCCVSQPPHTSTEALGNWRSMARWESVQSGSSDPASTCTCGCTEGSPQTRGQCRMGLYLQEDARRSLLIWSQSSPFVEVLPALLNYNSFCQKNQRTKIRWASIKDVAYVKEGQFYDLTVPGVGHYEGGGLLNHNSPDFRASQEKYLA